MDIKLKEEFAYFLAHHDELVEKYDGKFVVIKGQNVLDAFDDQVEAIRVTQKGHELGTFMVQKVSPGDKDYKQTFHSRVVFS